jgi:hypothetical protein
LRWLVDNLKANHGSYLLGELFVDTDKVINVSQIETYHPVIWGGNTVKLHYARAEDLREYLNLTAIRGEVVVQFWLKPGDEAALTHEIKNTQKAIACFVYNIFLVALCDRFHQGRTMSKPSKRPNREERKANKKKS